MCGIVGYVGKKNALEILNYGLNKLEYRGYDSSGMAIIHEGNLQVAKDKGRLANVYNLATKKNIVGNIGIGHTRWATHGEPNVINAHPHVSNDNKIALVHNGIIENYMVLKNMLINDYGINFISDTDTEVIVHLISIYYKLDRNLLKAVKRTTEKLKGAYALAVIANDNIDEIVTARLDSPLVIGKGDYENFVASDVPALLKYTKSVYYLENGEFASITSSEIKVYNNDLNLIDKSLSNITWTSDEAEKNGYAHFMIKEIHEQPSIVERIINLNIREDGTIIFPNIKSNYSDIENVCIISCGTSYHSGLVAKYWIEHYANLPTTVVIASEFNCRKHFTNDKTLFIFISQSGETSDTLNCLRKVKEQDAKTLVIVNTIGSSIARESTDIIYIHAGLEMAVAATKSYVAQLVIMNIFALYLAQNKKTLIKDEIAERILSLRKLPNQIKTIISRGNLATIIAQKYFDADSALFIGRGLDYETLLEAALKVKEISYINAFAIPSGELKHGTIALVEKNFLVLSAITQKDLINKSINSLQEVKARGARVFLITNENYATEKLLSQGDDIWIIPSNDDTLMPILTIIPLQLFAYNLANFKKCDIDKPRNLAKSVTVE